MLAQNNTEYEEEVKNTIIKIHMYLVLTKAKEKLKTQTDLFMKYA